MVASQSFFRSLDWTPSSFTKSSDNLSSLSSEPSVFDEVFPCLNHKSLHFFLGKVTDDWDGLGEEGGLKRVTLEFWRRGREKGREEMVVDIDGSATLEIDE